MHSEIFGGYTDVFAVIIKALGIVFFEEQDFFFFGLMLTLHSSERS